MLRSFSEFKFYQSFRIPVEKVDGLRFLIELEDERGKSNYIEDAVLVDMSVTGLGFSTSERILNNARISISLQFKKINIDISGKVVRAFTDAIYDEKIIYGVEIEDDKRLHKFLEQYILSFSPERLKDCLIHSALRERYTKASDGFEMFSLLLSLFKDITNFGDKDGFLDNMVEEMVRLLNAQRASIFLINPESNELEAVSALGVDKGELKFDYRLGIAGSVFTTGVALNIDTKNDASRFNENFDKKFGFDTKSIICYPIHNREDKIIGVIEVINKRNQDRFSVEDEKTMKVLTLVFSSVFHNYNPISESSQIRRFSTPFDRKYAFIGRTPHVNSLRNTIIRLKDLEQPVFVEGEKGVGKSLYASILHHEGQRGLKPFYIVDCGTSSKQQLESELFGKDDESKLIKCQGGTLFLKDIDRLPQDLQKKLWKVISEHGIPGSKFSLDVRFVSGSMKDLEALSLTGEFEKDLYQYLAKAYIYIEPLGRRSDDIPDLVDYYLKVTCKQQGLLLKNFSEKAMQKLREYDWPSNVTELKTCVERAVLYNPKSHIINENELENTAAPLFDSGRKKRIFGDMPFVNDHGIALKDRLALVERELILAEVKRNNGNKSQAAKVMGISREALRKKLMMSDQILEELKANNSNVKKYDFGKSEAAEVAEVDDLKKAA